MCGKSIELIYKMKLIRQLQASPFTVTVLGRQKSVTVSGKLLTVSLYQNIFIV